MRRRLWTSTQWALFSLCAVIAALAPSEAGALKTMAFTKTNGSFLVKFLYEEAGFGQPVDTNKTIVLHLSEPLHACSTLTNQGVGGQSSSSPVALIEKGGCRFDEKARMAQEAGFTAAIVYDNEDRRSLVKMLGDPTGVEIPAVFISRSTGQVLKRYTGRLVDMEVFADAVPPAITGLELGVVFVMLAVAIMVVVGCATKPSPVRSQTFSSAADDKSTSAMCTICLDDYVSGDQLMVLPCQHRFHTHCLDKWLSKGSCPVCKRSFERLTEPDDEARRTSSPPATTPSPRYWSSSAFGHLSTPSSPRSLYS